MPPVRTRFAPSPTGYLHIGGARTALYAYLFARQHGGQFLLRIEDTDRTRSEKRFADDIIEALGELGLEWDEGPVFQSDRLDLYREAAERLQKTDNAYLRDGALYFRVPQSERIVINDLIRGDVTFETGSLDDFVILKSDGYPTFHLAVVVDDALQSVTHIIRGEDHISNTPKQILLYRALGYKPPAYGHLPLIIGPDRAPLSKRHGDTALSDYLRQGYLPEALINFLARLGWGYQDQELFSKQELIELFDITRVNKAPAVFDLSKLQWMNAQYIRNASPERLYSLLNGRLPYDREYVLRVIRLFQPKAASLDDLREGFRYCLNDTYEFEQQVVGAYLSSPEADRLLDELWQDLSLATGWNAEALETEIRSFAERKGLKAAQVIHPLRAAVTGRKVTPGIFDLLETLGRDRTLQRLHEKRWHL